MSNTSDELRAKALELLQRAESLDGLQPVVVIHSQQYGNTIYLGWTDSNNGMLTEEQAESLLDSEFEEDLGESLTISNDLTLEELCGTKSECNFRSVKTSSDNRSNKPR